MSAGWGSITSLAAEMKGIHGNRIRKANAGNVRMHFLGAGYRTRGRPDPKRQVTQRCRALGHDVTDDNEADAIALWHYACACVALRTALATTPLFQGAAGGG